jgi:peptidoglycan/LPS O-acetylase OafA/YrhL
MTDTPHTGKIHLSGLNGLRAIAAMGVVLSHITLALASFGLNPFIFGRGEDNAPKGLILAGFGVTIFFSLSGFLITYLLLLEKEKAPVNVPHFYMRRILRIWPLYYIYLVLGVLAMISIGYGFDRMKGMLPYYVFFAASIPYILNAAIPVLAHYWSLGVEEQFYLIWPWIVKKTGKRLPLIIAVMIIILIGIKLFTRFIIPGNDTSVLYSVVHVSRFQCMLIGALGAVLFYNKQLLFMKICTHKIAQLFAWLIIVLIIIKRFHIASVLDQEFVSVITVLLIIGQSTVKNRLINLETGVMDFLGKISYGIYVIHPIVVLGAIKVFSLFVIPGPIKYPLVYSSIIAVTILLAYCSFNFIEKKFLKLKLKYSTIESSDSKQG